VPFSRLSLLFALLLNAIAPIESIQAEEIAIENVSVGFGGLYKVGRWTPVFVKFNSAPPVDAVLVIGSQDPDGNPTSTRSTTRWNSSGMYGEFRIGRLDAVIRVRLVDKDGTSLAEKNVRTADAVRGFELKKNRQKVKNGDLSPHLIVSVGPAKGFDELEIDQLTGETASLFSDGQHSVRFVSLESMEQLPIGPNGLDAVDLLVLASEFQMSPEQIESLEKWIRSGGHLVVATGKNVKAFADSPVAELLSGVIAVAPESNDIFELTGLESFSGRSSRIPKPGSRSVPSATVTATSGTILIRGREGPLLVESAFGFGSVVFLALDLNEKPLSNWDALPAACHRIVFGKRYKQADRSQSGMTRLSRSGVTDISTQLLSTQGEFDGVNRATSWTVMGMLLLYLLVIGPLDYLIVHRVLGRPRLTWFTFPLLVAAGAAVAIGSANQRNGSELKLNQLEIIDLNPASGHQVRGRSFFTVYSPSSRRFEATVNVPWGASEVVAKTSWSGVAENVFGGMYRSGAVALGRFPYSISNDNRTIDNLPIQTWSTQRLDSEWQTQGSIEIESRLTSSSMGFLTGSFSHNLPFSIDGWMLAYGNRVYRPIERESDPNSTRLLPRRAWTPASSRDLRSFLTGIHTRSVKGDNGKQIVNEQTDYDPLNDDPQYVLRMLTYDRIVGGTQYTGLRNDLFRELDLSSLVKLDFAVLFGRIDVPMARLSLDGDTIEPSRYSGFVRLVIPVERATTGTRELPDMEELGKQYTRTQEENRRREEREKAAAAKAKVKE
jgi:hypothetical protein